MINKLINNVVLVSGLMKQTVESLNEFLRKNSAFNIISDVKSMYQPCLTKIVTFALQRLKAKLSTLGSSPTKVADNFTVGSGADSEKADSIIYNI